MSRNKYPEETVALILDVAERLFLEKGYDKTTIQDIVNRMNGLSKGALYHHFKSKEEILTAVSRRIFAEPRERNLFAEVASSSLTPEKKLGAFFDAVLNDKTENRFRSLCPDLKKTPQLVVQLLDTAVSSDTPRYVADILAQGVQNGSIDTRYPERLAEVLMLLMNLYVNPLVYPATEPELQGKLDFVDELFSKYGVAPLAEILPKGSYRKILELATKA